MIKKTSLGKEIVVTMYNKIGLLAEMCKLLAEHGIDIQAVNGYAVDSEAVIMLLTDDNLRAMDALKKAKYEPVAEHEVILLELDNKPGAMKLVTGELARQGIDIKHVYGTACCAGCPVTVVLSTSDNEKALLSLRP